MGWLKVAVKHSELARDKEKVREGMGETELDWRQHNSLIVTPENLNMAFVFLLFARFSLLRLCAI